MNAIKIFMEKRGYKRILESNLISQADGNVKEKADPLKLVSGDPSPALHSLP